MCLGEKLYICDTVPCHDLRLSILTDKSLDFIKKRNIPDVIIVSKKINSKKKRKIKELLPHNESIRAVLMSSKKTLLMMNNLVKILDFMMRTMVR